MGCKILKLVTWPWPRPFQGSFVISRLGHSMINLPNKLEVPTSFDHGLSARYITAEITCGKYSENILFIPRIPLSPTDSGLPFTLRRRQFHVRPAFAIWPLTINKTQGQTLQRVGVLLDDPVSVHSWTSRNGDAVTQATSYFFVQSLQTVNVMYSEVLSCW